MQGTNSWAQKAQFYAQISLVYTMTVAFGWFTLHPVHRLPGSQLVSITKAQQVPVSPALSRPGAISGKPVRLVIPDSGIALAIDDGYYDSDTNAWTLSPTHAQFAMTSSLSNTEAGDTFVYGHNNNLVFGALRHNTPAIGAKAMVFTDNGHIFTYKFQSVSSLTPDDTTALHYQGPPVMTIQTCTGSTNEWRTLFRFTLEQVV